jgi:hypothetical protein
MIMGTYPGNGGIGIRDSRIESKGKRMRVCLVTSLNFKGLSAVRAGIVGAGIGSRGSGIARRKENGVCVILHL